MSSTPDLHKVLATLAQLSQPQSQQQSQQQQQQQQYASQPRSVIDPATIVTWQEGLRCVTKISAQNKDFEATIRRLMREQSAQEMRWYSERQQLKRIHVNRQRSSAQAQSILQSLTRGQTQGDLAAAGTVDCDAAVDAAAELSAFDLKIHQAQVQMQTQAALELKAIGVPFFGTDPTLVHVDGKTEDRSETDPASTNRTISRSDLFKLQKRMIDHLEDLFRD